ncbi:helix-turn-helix transcriptional regulator [Acuticoccus mangrovi]|uniref:AraC family transcriptional regulator ligand-binding domain-containing protein n=1 Tax=Acuticoccus mangrovi TaxID=2796142 RepID=A0A934IP76_9HYPH|nr:AraC family transcriptional regulator [Acuticoccus mangrovi]MBJ3778516.1 AraC family transcriptional regulator ligand-binding domain-containing protein [Acuticoccus mangrovi]
MQRTFEAVGVPQAVIEAPHIPIPLRAMIALHDRAAHCLGDRTFGLELGQTMAATAYGRWREYGALAPDLGTAIRRLCNTLSMHQTGAHLSLLPMGDRYVWRYWLVRRFDVDVQTHADHVLGPMLLLCQHYLGLGWKPEFVELSYRRDPDAGLIEERLQIPVRFEQPGVGVVLKPADLLQRQRVAPAGCAGAVTLREVVADVVLADAPEPARSIAAVVTLRLLDGRADIDGVAQMTDLSVQSLQRRLREKGYTYREIVNQARHRRAEALLRETEMSVLDIALSLGYEDHPNFSRAFRRWAGCAPSTYRNTMREAALSGVRAKRK